MPATILPITAVDHTNDTITIGGGGHDLTSGDGWIAIYSPDGGTLPGGLAPVTDYWAIRVSDTVLKLAASSSDAIANVPIPLSSNGSGTLQLLRGLPYRRPRVAANLQQIYSDDLNQTWLAIVALWNLLTAQPQNIWSAVKLAVPLTLTGPLTLADDLKHGDRDLVVSAPTFNAAGQTTIATPSLGDDWALFGTPPNDTIRANVPLRVGDRIKSIVWHFNKNSSSAALVMKLRTRNGTTNTDRDTLTDVTSGAAYTSVTRSAINYTIAAGDATTLVVQASNSAHRFSHAVVTYDRP